MKGIWHAHVLLKRAHTWPPRLSRAHVLFGLPHGFSLVVIHEGVFATASPTGFALTARVLSGPGQVWRHRIGTDPDADELVYHEEDDAFYIALSRSRSNKLIFLDISSLLLCPGDTCCLR